MHDTNKKPHTSKKTARFACAYFTGFRPVLPFFMAAGGNIAHRATEAKRCTVA